MSKYTVISLLLLNAAFIWFICSFELLDSLTCTPDINGFLPCVRLGQIHWEVVKVYSIYNPQEELKSARFISKQRNKSVKPDHAKICSQFTFLFFRSFLTSQVWASLDVGCCWPYEEINVLISSWIFPELTFLRFEAYSGPIGCLSSYSKKSSLLIHVISVAIPNSWIPAP